ncbi:AbiH family protein [Leifsonia sp. F6_8S_P_1B]|uniref:AbiH family protein n=1 Tax=Leifsonia williamsii TaxID=3035919 RepID=A0ABT8KG02_9MICO|nr:AbiH family protein [Leifsonia williamsii]MDN4615937.1 AbiH family protein [Leifsonia williamsii]
MQHNIMAFVGNGFDLQVADDYAMPVDTRYTSFYYFLKLRSFDPSNPILREMERLRDADEKNWSDVEAAVEGMLRADRTRAIDLADALRRIQEQFSQFLELAVPASLLVRLGADSMKAGAAVTSLQEFLGDLEPAEYASLRFPKGIRNFDVFNFLFINFNYTSLLDDFVYLDQVQFDPRPYKTVDRNFHFKIDPGASERDWGDIFYSYVTSEVVHPHGHQSIPRSLLFGIDMPNSVRGNQDPALRLAKPFWAQNDLRYRHLFDDTELFIVFGCSLGESDKWWWKNIADHLGQDRQREDGMPSYSPELILYWFNGGADRLSADDVRDKFLEFADPAERGRIAPFIHVVLHDANTRRSWLSTSAL